MRTFSLLAFFGVLVLASFVNASAHTWEVTSPDQGQTFAYGSEKNRQWIPRGGHLSIAMEFTNDPYVDRVEIRQYDDFNFNFPSIVLGRDGKTFFYHPPGHAPVAVATQHSGFLGTETRLLSSSYLDVQKVHGLLRLTLLVSDRPVVADE